MGTKHDETHLWWRELDVGTHGSTGPHPHGRVDARSLTGAGTTDLPSTAVLVELRDRLATWERTAGHPADAYHERSLGAYLAGLRVLVDGEPDRVRGVLLAALALGPRDGGLPGAGDMGELLRMAADPTADVLDLAVAWGCGWHRLVWPEHGGWHARWVAAILALSALVQGSINHTVDWLEDNVPHLREALRADGERDQRLEGYADAIAVELATGGCRCGHGNLRHRSMVGACGRREHALEQWRPEVCRLRAFIATAVRGSAKSSVAPGAFSISMLSGLLREDQLLRVETAEFRVCHRCNGDLVRQTVQRGRKLELGSLGRGLYDLSRCPRCETPPDPDRTYRVGRKNWLIVPADWGGQHQPVHRFRCGGCGNLYTTERTRCPLCGVHAPHRDRRTCVWVRHVGIRRAS